MGISLAVTGGVPLVGLVYETLDGRDAECKALLPNNMARFKVVGHAHEVKYTQKGHYWDVNRGDRNHLWRLVGWS